jgi:hypothetical protein
MSGRMGDQSLSHCVASKFRLDTATRIFYDAAMGLCSSKGLSVNNSYNLLVILAITLVSFQLK